MCFLIASILYITWEKKKIKRLNSNKAKENIWIIVDTAYLVSALFIKVFHYRVW